MEYNLVRNAQLSYLINDGVHNRILSENEVSYIDDNDITFENSILVSGTEYLIFETSFNRRIKIDKVKLYLYSTTASGITLDHLNFYYSNDNDLDYEIVTDKFVGDNNFYYVELPFPSAPMKVKVTVSGLDCSISEYFISNDDYPIGFGKDGDLSKLYITRTDDNDRTDSQRLEIYNRNNNSINNLATAYICIDYTGEDGDKYLKISDNADSGFIGIEDNIFIEDNELNNTYIWDMGRFSETKISNNELVLDLNENIYKKGDIPHPDTAGVLMQYGESILDEDELKRVLYITISDYYLKLYKYSYVDDTWDFIGKINPGCTGWETANSICRIDNYIYVLINNQCEFGRYNLNGEENNWEALEIPPTHSPIDDNDMFCICSDKKEYIYFISYLYGTGNSEINPDANFARYSTISGSVTGWESLSNEYEHEYSNIPIYTKCLLHYNIDDDCLYFMSGLGYGVEYIRRYDVNTNIWDNSWFKLNQFMTAFYNISFCYKNGLIYILNKNYLYTYDVKYYNFNILVKYSDTYYYTTTNSCIIVVDSLTWTNEFQVIFLGSGSDYYNQDNIYWYNGILLGGNYITPVFDIIDSYKSSYFLIDYELQQNTAVTNAKFEDMNLMELKSSDIPLLEIERIYFIKGVDVKSINLYTDSLTDIIPNFDYTINQSSFFSYDIDNKTGEMCASYSVDLNYYIVIYNYDGTKKIEIHDEKVDNYRLKFTTIKFDSSGGIYGYDKYERLFTHLDASLNVINRQSGETAGLWTLSGMVYVQDFCIGDDLTVWYIHSGFYQLRHCDRYFNELNTITLTTPYALEPDQEGGVWVIYNNRMGIIKYNKSYNIELTLSFNEPVSKISSDKDGGLWVIQDLLLKYFSKDGTIVKKFMLTNYITWMSAGYKSCFLYTNSLKIGYFFRYPDGLIKEILFDETQFLPILFFCHTYEDELLSKKDYLPVSYDPNWGTNGTIEWKDVQVNGYYLPKNKYHQLKITLKTGINDNTPKVKKIKLAPSIKLVDIQKNTYKSIYLKLDVPDQFKNQTYNTKLKCWWEDKE